MSPLPNRRWMDVACAAALAVWGSAYAQSGGDVDVATDLPGRMLGRSVEIAEDPRGLNDIDAVAGGALQWSKFQEDVPNFGYSDSTYWVRLRLRNSAARPWEGLVSVAYPPLDLVEFYRPAPAGGWERMSAGDTLPFAERPIAARAPAFPLRLAAGESTAVYLMVRSQGTVAIPVSFWTPQAFAADEQRARFAFGLFYGALAAMVLYNAILFLTLRDPSTLHYIGFLTALSVFLLTENGLAYELLWPNWPWWAHRVSLVSFGTCVAFGVLFARGFLMTRRFSPTLDTLLVGTAITAFALSSLPLVNAYSLAARLSLALSLAAVTLSVAAVIWAWRGGFPPARWWAASWTPFLFGAICAALAGAGLVPTSPLTAYGMQIGAAAGAVLLSFVIGSRIQQLRNEKEEAEHRSGIDPLTGLANRRRLEQVLEREWRRAARHGSQVSALLIDIDHFKRYNDLYGHLNGDRCLRAVAEAIDREFKRPGDLLVRYGGEEFLALLPDTDAAGAAFLARRVLAAVAELKIVHEGSPVQPFVTVSVGVATMGPDSVREPRALFSAADAALYEAKRAGRNQLARHGLV